MKNDPTIKIIGFSALGLIVLWLVKAVIFPTGYGVSVRYNMPGYSRNSFEHGYNSSAGFSSFSSSIFQVLMVIFIIALLTGLVMILKNYFLTPEDINTIKGTFIGKSKLENKACVKCGKELNPEWKVCPHCGKDVEDEDKH